MLWLAGWYFIPCHIQLWWRLGNEGFTWTHCRCGSRGLLLKESRMDTREEVSSPEKLFSNFFKLQPPCWKHGDDHSIYLLGCQWLVNEIMQRTCVGPSTAPTHEVATVSFSECWQTILTGVGSPSLTPEPTRRPWPVRTLGSTSPPDFRFGLHNPLFMFSIQGSVS